MGVHKIYTKDYYQPSDLIRQGWGVWFAAWLDSLIYLDIDGQEL